MPADTSYKKMTAFPFWTLVSSEALHTLMSSLRGLSENEAANRLSYFGKNEMRETRRMPRTRIALNQFTNPLIITLIVAGIITAFLQEWVNAAVILFAVLVNAALGYFQENKAAEVLQLLKSYVRVRARVRRSDAEREIDASELVPGDIIRVSQGDRVPADAKIIYKNNLFIDESILTGESMPVEKNTEPNVIDTTLAERTSMIFGGTMVVEGFADAAVTATAGYTEFGRIAAMTQYARHEPTPLQKSITRFTVRAGAILIVLTTFLFILGLRSGYGVFYMFLISVAVAVSAVPEGLAVALTVILAVGVERLAKKNGIVRKLLAVETLGSTNIILTDKTGTLTQAKMHLEDIVCVSDASKYNEKMILHDALADSDVFVENADDPYDMWRIVGRPLEIALVQGAAQRGVLLPDIRKDNVLIDKLPFNSTNKFSICVSRRGSKAHLIVVGAPEIVTRFSDIRESKKNDVLREINTRAYAGERLIGVATKEVSGDIDILVRTIAKAIGTNDLQHHFSGLILRGLIAFRDPLRPMVKDALSRIAAAGVRTIIVTGDHAGTALSVAKELGIADSEDEMLSGDEFARYTADEWPHVISRIKVFARVTPQQKLMLTELYKKAGNVVAVTGDGINDAPALAAADIGVALGFGTDVTKHQADLVILDNNFETIVAAIEEGRAVLGNLKKVIMYLMLDSLDELLLIGGSILAGIALPINALQILFVNLFSDSFPAIAFAFERGSDNHGSQPANATNIFDETVKFFVFVVGVATSVILFVLYYALISFGFDDDVVKTFIFASFATYTLLLAFSLRNMKKNIWAYNPLANRYLTSGVGIGFLMVGLALYMRPLGNILGTVPLSLSWVGAVFAVGCFNVALAETGKWILLRKNGNMNI